MTTATITADDHAFLRIIAARAARNAEVCRVVESGDMDALRSLIPSIMQREIASEDVACQRVYDRTERGHMELTSLVRGVWYGVRLSGATR